jgi:hypothetical protein
MPLITAMSFIFVLMKGTVAFSTPDYLSTLSCCTTDELKSHSEKMLRMHQVDHSEQQRYSSGALTPRLYECGVPNLDQIRSITPDDHYAKHYTGAGWAGYNHPLYGGYLNNLKQNNLE